MIRRQSAPIQRGPTDATVSAATELGTVAFGGGAPLTLFRLDGRRNALFNPDRINGDALALLKTIPRLTRLERLWQPQIAILAAHHGGGPTQLQAVTDAKGAIGDAAKDRNARETINNYLAAIDGAKVVAGEVEEKHAAVKIAVEEVNKLAITKEKQRQGRKVEELEGAVAGEEKDIAEQQRVINGLIGTATYFVDPTKWVGFAVNLAIIAGQEIVERNWTSSHLEYLQGQLKEARAELQNIEDRALLKEIEIASSKLDLARLDLANERAKFLDAAAAVRRMERPLTTELGQSEATRGAAGAIAERGAVTKAALDAEQLLTEFLDAAATAQQYAETLDVTYARVSESAGVAGVARDEDHARHLAGTADLNRAELPRLNLWLTATRDEAVESLAFVGEGDYLAGYADIPKGLSEAVE